MSASLGSASGSITLDVSSFAKGIASAQGQLNSFGSATKSIGAGLASSLGPLDDFASRAQRAGTALDAVAKQSAIFGGAVAAGVAFAAGSFATFEQQINQVGVVSGATEAQLKQLSDLALQIGKDTTFGATEAAQALTELARAGVPLETILAGAGRSAVDLAAAMGTDLGNAANIVANTLNVFATTGLTAADAVDILTAAANASSADINDLGAGLRLLGPVVVNLGGNLQDAAAAIAFFTNFGQKAANAAVSLAAGINQAAAPTKEAATLMHELGVQVFDAQGKFVGFPALFDNLKQSLGGLSDQQRTLAINLIFGAQAQDVINIAVKQGAAGYEQLRASIEPTGQAAEAANARMKGLAGSLEQMKGSVENVAIAFGGALAPAIEKVAGIIGSVADAFAALPGPVQQTAAALIAGAGGFALLAAATAKAISLALSTVGAFKQMATIIRESAVAMRLLSAAVSPVGLAFVGVALVTGLLIARHHAHQQAVKDLEGTYKDLIKTINDLKLAGQDQIAKDLNKASKGYEEATKFVKGFTDTLETQKEEQLKLIESGQGTAEQVVAAKQEYDRLDAQVKSLTGSTEQLNAGQKGITEAFTQSGVDTVKLLKHVEDLDHQYATGAIGAADYFGALAALPSVTADYALAAKDAAAGTGALTDEQIAAKNAGLEHAAALKQVADAQKQYLKQIDDIGRSTVQQIKGFDDASQSLAGMQTGYKRVGENVGQALLRMDRLNRLNLTPAQEEVIHLVDKIERIDKGLATTEGAIQQNAQDMSMWAGRIQLVDDTLGTAADGYDKLNKLVADGKVTQEEANKIQTDGAFLRERSVVGIEDEQAAQARLISTLADYVRAHDDAAGAVGNLTAQQQGFLAALQSSQGQTALQTIQTLAYLAALGLIPAEKVTKFAVDAGDADPVVKALLTDLGLIPPEKNTDVTTTSDTSGATDVGNAIDNIPAETEKKVTVTADTAGLGDGTDVGAGLEVGTVTIPTALGAPDQSAAEVKPEEVTVPAKIDTPDDSAVTGYKPATIEIPTKLGAPDDSAVTGYKPAMIKIPTSLAVPEASSVANYEPAQKKIPTSLAVPEASSVANYEPATKKIPTSLAVPEASNVANYDPAQKSIPTSLGTPDDSKVTDYKPAAVVIPTIFGTPGFVEGSSVHGPDDVIIPTSLGTPTTTNVDNYKPPTITVPTDLGTPSTTVSIDTSVAQTALDTINTNLDAFAERDDESTLSADSGPADLTFNALQSKVIEQWSGNSFTANLEATDNASSVIQTVADAAAGLERTYTVTITADTSAATAAIAALGRNLPSSPAKEGPLSKVPSFDYVVDSFVKSMTAMTQEAKRSLSDVSNSLDGLSSIKALKSSMMIDGAIPWEFRGTTSSAALARSGAAMVTHNVDARTFNALHSEDLINLLDKAERGSDSHAWIIEQSRKRL